MKSNPSAVRRAAALLTEDARRFEPVARADADRAVDAVARAIRARVARRKRTRLAIGVAAMAAGVLAVVGAGRALHRSAPVERAAAPTPAPPAAIVEDVHGSVLAVNGSETSRVLDGRAAKTGDRFVALQGATAAVRLPSGTRVTLEGGGDVAWLEQGIFGLDAGAVRADVVKLAPGERFVVRTHDAEVEVHGTSFRVASAPPEPACGGGTTTRVEVYEGVVTVRAGALETRVPAGARWPTCDAPAAPPLPSAPPPRPQPTAARKVSDLAAQNDLFDTALAAERRGDLALAVATLDDFLARYPSSALSENALAERMKVLGKLDRDRARDAARAYLRRYPKGFARADAEALAGAAN